MNAIAIALVVLVVLVTWLRDGPQAPGAVAVGYLEAEASRDFGRVWELSASELRAGDNQAEFVARRVRASADHTAIVELDRIDVERVEVEQDLSCVVARTYLRSGRDYVDELLLRSLGGEWRISDASLPAGDCPFVLKAQGR